MAAPVRVLMLVSILIIFGIGVYDMIANVEKNACEMTYMYVTPEYLKVPLKEDVQKRFPKYSLHLYAEGRYARESESMRLSGIPALFIPGNAGSYRQARSIGSVALKKAQDAKLPYHFNVFTINFNEEFSGMFGGVLETQTRFAHECIKHILTLYPEMTVKPKSVLLIGHSMGGMIARGLFTLPGFKRELVHTVITQATPHQAPVISADSHLAEYYSTVNGYWAAKRNTTLKDVTVFSTSGGPRDFMVRSGLATLDGLVDEEKSISTSTTAMPRVWASTDHLCHVWCKQLVLATVRAMFDSIGAKDTQLAVNPVYRMGSFQHHFVKSPGGKKYRGGSYDIMRDLDPKVKWEATQKLSWSLSKDKVPKTRYVVMKIPTLNIQDTAFVSITNSPEEGWVGPCSMKGKTENCKQIGNLGTRGNMLPPLYSEKKVVHLDYTWLEDFTHMISILPKSKTFTTLMSEMYRKSERHLQYNVTGLVDILVGFPRAFLARHHVIRRSQERALFYNVSLHGLDSPLQAYRAHIWTRRCEANVTAGNFAGAVMKLHVPWNREDTYTTVGIGENSSHSLKLQTGRPEGYEIDPQLHLYLHPACQYTVAISISWEELFGQFVRFYAPLLPAYVFIQLLMGLSWQLKNMDEQGFAPDFATSHTNWAQPWRVVPVSLGLRLMLYWPEEDAIASRLGIPADDRSILEDQMRIFYPALPILLYLTSYAAVHLFSYVLHAVVVVGATVLSPCLKGFVASVHSCNAGRWLQVALFSAAIVVASTVCGTLSIAASCVIFFARSVVAYLRAKRQETAGVHKWSAFHLDLTLTLLLLMLTLLNAPSFIVWAKNLKYSFVLDVDPSRSLGILVPLTGLMVVLGRFPLPYVELYSVTCMVAYFACVLMILFCTLSTHRLQYYVGSVLTALALSAVLPRLFPSFQASPVQRLPPQRRPLPPPCPHMHEDDDDDDTPEEKTPPQEGATATKAKEPQPEARENHEEAAENTEEEIPAVKPKREKARKRAGKKKAKEAE